MSKWGIIDMAGYQPKTTYWQDFCIAEDFGLDAIQDTFNTAFETHKDDMEYGTELTMVLNWKIWQWYETDTEKARLYDKLWKEIDGYIMENWKDEKLAHFLRATD